MSRPHPTLIYPNLEPSTRHQSLPTVRARSHHTPPQIPSSTPKRRRDEPGSLTTGRTRLCLVAQDTPTSNNSSPHGRPRTFNFSSFKLLPSVPGLADKGKDGDLDFWLGSQNKSLEALRESGEDGRGCVLEGRTGVARVYVDKGVHDGVEGWAYVRTVIYW